jgi:isopentenyl diphosphate isomerase/L-lactate dehydrogenase-like FMN-dependent dehydrogenase
MAVLDRCYNIADLREAAQRRLPRGVFEFVDRGSEDEVALRNNRAGFERIKLRHRALVDVSGRSMATTLFGKPVGMPMAIAPTGAAGLCWHEGEMELAKAAAKAKIPFSLATSAMTSMEKIAEQAGPAVGGRLWFQLYVWNRREFSYQMIERAKAAGFEALIVTVDTIVSPNREYNQRNGFLLPFHPTVRFTVDIMRHPAWAASVLLKYFTTIGMPRNENFPEPYRRRVTSNPDTFEVMRQDSLCWDDIKIFRKMWPGILMLKGINRPDDAVKAIEYGVDGIIVSNHGGRNMDSAVASIDALPDIAEAVGERATVLLDSGVRRGSDIAKALALGAKAVLTGRVTLYGTAVAGAEGAGKAIGIIRSELDKTMAYTGCCSVDEISTDIFFADSPGNRLRDRVRGGA